jgi:Protein of unknown function (DUF4058)
MPGPFPGMDPYIEDVELWRGADHWFISAASEQLQPQLNPRGYYVDVETRIWMEEAERAIYPDVIVRQLTDRGSAERADAGGILIADEPVRMLALETEVREDYLQIYEMQNRRLVAGIEFISPSNKADHQTRELYLRKRKELWQSEVNVVEIDLLRGGKPLVRLPQSALKKIPLGGYVINVMRVGTAGYEFYPLDIRKRLPRVGIPLKPGEPDVVLDLQAAVNRVYDVGAYSMRIDYNREPDPPLDEEMASWASNVLIAAGVRKPPGSAGPANGPGVSSE